MSPTWPSQAEEIHGEFLFEKVEHAWEIVARQLIEARTSSGHWTGQLSTSALSTATAISALEVMSQCGCVPDDLKVEVGKSISCGCRWLVEAQNSDGGFGDTNLSHSNIATTLLVLAAWRLTGFDIQHGARLEAVNAYVDRVGKWDALRKRYGQDKTFVVPILTNCALAKLVDWSEIPALPFEAAWLPQTWYRLARLPVVSYALPALVAMGQAHFYHLAPRNPIVRIVRERACEPTLRVLARMQPSSGGYLEAVPLTSFVLMSLASIGKGNLPVSQRCLRFILNSRLADGSWPIDTNLATWVTSLAIGALGRGVKLNSVDGAGCCLEGGKDFHGSNGSDERYANHGSHPSRGKRKAVWEEAVSPAVVRWLLNCQHLSKHPYTGAEPGGWAWTNLSGGVPDADDTPAALIALAKWYRYHAGSWPILDRQILKAVAAGLKWLTILQNSNGGWPTFCRGWGKLPFDRSGTDLTAHAMRAIEAWRWKHDKLCELESETPSRRRLDNSQKKGLKYLSRQQRVDGSWLPLWFGNQDFPSDENPIYGTAKVLLAYGELGIIGRQEAQKGLRFLERSQNPDGGWGGGTSVPYRAGQFEFALSGSSIEETSVTIESLIMCGSGGAYTPTIMRGLRWLATVADSVNLRKSWPIGFYFAKLWYHEQLYPAIFCAGALGAALTQWDNCERLARIT